MIKQFESLALKYLKHLILLLHRIFQNLKELFFHVTKIILQNTKANYQWVGIVHALFLNPEKAT
jgi:hypothetical protein